MSINITTHKGRDNVAGIRLLIKDQPVDASQLTRVALIGKKGSIDSADNPELFELTETEVRIKFGLSDLPVGRDYLTVVGYDTQNTQGIRFGVINLIMIAS